MKEESSIFCWHHSGEKRLEKLLEKGLIDCPSEGFLNKHNLVPGDIIRVSLKVRNEARGNVIALTKLVSSLPFPLDVPEHKIYPYAVRIEVIERGDLGICFEYPYNPPPPMNPSHWV